MRTGLTVKQSAKAREAALKVGIAYCQVWYMRGGKKKPHCKKCKFARLGKDCAGNPIGQLYQVMAARYALSIDEQLAGQTTMQIVELLK